MSKETDFLVLYPCLEAVREKGSALLKLMDDLFGSLGEQEGPDTTWIPPLQQACDDIVAALEAPSLKDLDQEGFQGFREAVRIIQKSFEVGDSLLLDAYPEIDSAIQQFDTFIQSWAAGAFGKWGAYFFLLCAPNLDRYLFDPRTYLEERPARPRDHLWLRWSVEEGLGPAAIRDRWNGMSKEEREAVAPRQANTIGKGEPGRGTVKKGLSLAKLELG